ncbi:MAG TPA: hypothetical protein EYQ14_03405 [Gammaproteobacteria bacterium]|nr:hypothetical protein [Gammaproteobacteria bacterium]HIL98782.1 hypothetical protein [Pseudomonadales bacterium]
MEEIPDFKSYTNVKQKKHDFFNFMLPLVRRANASVARDREYVQALAGQQSLSKPETARLLDLMKQYRLEASETPADQLDALLVKIDTVPASLILAQSANESAWGTSRFATEANNFFGIWCFSRGCGLTPKDRDDGLSHEVARFDSVQHGVGRYIHTLNSHPAYEQLRTIRLEQRQNGKDLSGIELAEGLVKYSERGAEYVEEIQSMISYNKLQQYNLATSESSAVLLSE